MMLRPIGIILTGVTGRMGEGERGRQGDPDRVTEW